MRGVPAYTIFVCFLFHVQSESVKPAPQEATRRWGVGVYLKVPNIMCQQNFTKQKCFSATKRLMYVRSV